jgi:hypothetical protein
MVRRPAPTVYRLSKLGSTAQEYEDAIAWSSRRGRYAVADGASASAFARLWAQLLVRGYVAGQLSASCLETDLAPLQQRWACDVEQRELPWYAQEQARRGAFAALAGLSIDADGTWTAMAVGDTCLFHVRDDVMLTALPLSDADAFDSRPLLLGSRPLANATLRGAGAIVCAEGTWRPGDTFLLMSDALAAMFLREGGTLDALNFAGTSQGFKKWVSSRREESRLRNDDVSLLWLTLPAA